MAADSIQPRGDASSPADIDNARLCLGDAAMRQAQQLCVVPPSPASRTNARASAIEVTGTAWARKRLFLMSS